MTSTAWMRARTVATAVVALSAAQAASAAIIMSDFAADEDGWWSNVSSSQTNQPFGGNSTGYFQATGDGSVTPEAWAADKFTGNQTHSLGGTMSFDAIVVDPQLAHSVAAYVARITIFGDGGSASHDFVPTVNIGRFWGHFEVGMTGADWGVSNGQLSSLLSNVTGISFGIYNTNGLPAIQSGYDNVMITPTPGAAALLAMAAGLLSRRRR